MPVSQLEATLEGHPVDVHIRTSKFGDSFYVWLDSTSNKYVHCLTALEHKCVYEMTMEYKKILKSKPATKQNNVITECNPIDDSDDIHVNTTKRTCLLCQQTLWDDHEFLDLHPGKHCCKLAKL